MRFLTLLTILILPLNSHALLEFEDAAFPELITSARALALGNAYSSKVDDSWAAFYNPAGLGTVRQGMIMQLWNLHLEANNGFFDITGNGNFGDSAGNYSKALEPVGMKELLVENPGHTSHARVQAFPNITFRFLSLGFMYSKQNRARLKSSTDDLEFAERTDWGPMASLAFPLFGGILKFGATAIYLSREQMQKDFAQDEEVRISKDEDYTYGTMTHITYGVRLTLPIFLMPTFSYVVRNATNEEFANEQYAGLPTAIPMTSDASFSITPIIGRTTRIHFEVVKKDLGNKYDNVPESRKTGFGLEIDWARMMFARFGYGDGWGSAGVGVRAGSFLFDITTYAIEGSEEGVREDEDRRTVFSFSQGF